MINRAPPDFLTPDMAGFSVRVADWFEKLRDNICGRLKLLKVKQKTARYLTSHQVIFSVKTGHVTAVVVAKYR